jgi:hypothetical protein
MNPNTGEILPLTDIQALPPEERVKFSVELTGPEDEVRQIGARVTEAIKAERRAKNKAARKARRANR